MRTILHENKSTVFRAFGLKIKSELALPDVLRAAEQQGAADVHIRIGDLSEDWAVHGHPGEFYAYDGNELLLFAPGIAIYRVREGNEIIVSPMEGADDASICLYLLGTCMGAILIQRRILPLHGSAVVIGGKAYAFVGESGAGKSTLAAAFLHSGYSLLTDDVIAVKPGGPEQPPEVIPAYPQQKLWQQSLDHFGMEAGRYRTLYETKYAVPVTSRFCTSPVPLAGIFELAKAEGDRVTVDPCRGLNRLPLLFYHTYRSFLIPQLADGQWHFSTISSVGSRIPLYRLRRPAAGFTAHDLVEQVLHTIKEGA